MLRHTAEFLSLNLSSRSATKLLASILKSFRKPLASACRHAIACGEEIVALTTGAINCQVRKQSFATPCGQPTELQGVLTMRSVVMPGRGQARETGAFTCFPIAHIRFAHSV